MRGRADPQRGGPGARAYRPGPGRRAQLGEWLPADRMVYGLIKVRTDGKRIVMAVKKEGDSRFQIEELTA
jgi:hypothetical protein